MPARSRSEAEESPGTSSADGTTVSVLETSPGRSVFVEEDNTDGWIATDLTVELRD